MISEALNEILKKYLESKKEDIVNHSHAAFVRGSSKNLVKPTLWEFSENFLGIDDIPLESQKTQ